MSYNHKKCYRHNSLAPRIAPEAIAMLCLHRPSGLEVLPHLETLKWSTNGSTTPILPFLSARIKTLEVDLTGDLQSVDDFFRTLAGRTPLLKHFNLKTFTAVKDIKESLRKAISTWQNLKVLVLPPYYLRPMIVEAVASLPNLTNLEHEYTYYPPHDETAMLQELPENPFPKLACLGFNSNPPSAQRLATKYLDLFTRLISIHIDAANNVGGEEVLEFVRHLGRNCVQLIYIDLNLCLGMGPHGQVASPLSFTVLQSLFPCRRLQVLLIGHPHPLTINKTDVEWLAVAWPKLEIFDICKEPHSSYRIHGATGNPLSILPVFARHFPKMKVLGLFFDNDQNLNFSGDLYPEYEFCRLEALCVGVSAVPGGRSRDVGFLIASLCKVEPTIEIGPSVWYAGPEHAEWIGYQRQWEEARDFLQFAMRTKIASRAKASGIVD
ncbi:hypothetical protein FS837_006871 [Tulasnella sp. UAMH 9824]|nr:hypothetical protein FS837_006871 [Tulasnella sp. UAMH 9824]